MYHALNQEQRPGQTERGSVARLAAQLTRQALYFGLVLTMAGLVSPLQAAEDGAEPNFPRTMSWSAYNLGTTGYNQAVAIGKALKDNYNVNLRVLPGKNDVSRLLPLQRGRVQFSANGVATYFAQEGVFQFAGKTWGPMPLRIVMASHGESNQALGVANDLGIKTYADLRGKRVPYVRGAPALNVTTEAFLACGGLTWEDVERVDFPGYSAMWTGVVNGQVDAAYATTVSGPTRKLEASPRGIFGRQRPMMMRAAGSVWPLSCPLCKSMWRRAGLLFLSITPMKGRLTHIRY